MNVEIYINGTERENIHWRTFQIKDRIDNQINELNFSLVIENGNAPSISDDVEVYNGATKIFAGEILDVSREMEGLKEVAKIIAVDYTHNLGRSLIVERFSDKTVNYIINYLAEKYHPEFTSLSDCTTEVQRITFDNISVKDAIEELANLTNYRWYVDYDKNIKFFSQYEENAPFDLTDDNGKYIFRSLVLVNDASQIRNSVKIRGGEMVGEERTEKIDADGAKDIFSLSNKFSEKPTVTVDSVAQNVGVEFLDDEEDYDCFWNYNEKYVRFSTAPASGSNAIEVTGTPLIPIIVQKTDSGSIGDYGLRQFFKWDKALRSQEEVALYANSQLDAYKTSIVEGGFETYEDGLVTGQKINISSTLRNINEDFIVQEVKMRLRNHKDGVYSVSLATTRTLGIIQVLQNLLGTEKKILTRDQEQEPLLTYGQTTDEFEMEDTLQSSTEWTVTSPPYTWEAATGDSEANPIVWNMFTWEDEES